VDVSNPCFEEHIEAVERIVSELGLDHMPRVLVFNKEDKRRPEEVEAVCRKYKALSISSLRPKSLDKLFQVIRQTLGEERRFGVTFPSHGLTNGASFDISDKTYEEVRTDDGIPS